MHAMNHGTRKLGGDGNTTKRQRESVACCCSVHCSCTTGTRSRTAAEDWVHLGHQVWLRGNDGNLRRWTMKFVFAQKQHGWARTARLRSQTRFQSHKWNVWWTWTKVRDPNHPRTHPLYVSWVWTTPVSCVTQTQGSNCWVVFQPSWPRVCDRDRSG